MGAPTTVGKNKKKAKSKHRRREIARSRRAVVSSPAPERQMQKQMQEQTQVSGARVQVQMQLQMQSGAGDLQRQSQSQSRGDPRDGQTQSQSQNGAQGTQKQSQSQQDAVVQEDVEGGVCCAGLPLVDLEILPRPSRALAKMYDLFLAYTGLGAFLFYEDRITGQWQEEGLDDAFRMPRYCEMIRSARQGLHRCERSHREMLEETTRSSGNGCRRCHAGLVSVHFGVAIQGGRVADLQSVGALEQDLPRDEFPDLLENVSDLGLPKESLIQAAESLAVLHPGHAEQVSKWLHLFANYFSELSSPFLGGKAPEAPEAPSRPPLQDASVQQLIRREVGRRVLLPPAEGEVSCGCSAALVESVLDFVDEHHYLPLSTQLVAFGLGFEPSYFSKMFKHFAKESLSKHLKRTRLGRAKKLMENPYLSVAEIARRTGFSDASYFTRVFRSTYGITPSQFRQVTRGHF